MSLSFLAQTCDALQFRAMLKKAVIAISFAALSLTQAKPQIQPQSQPSQSQTAQPAPAQTPAFTVKQIGKGVYAAISGRAGGNTGFIIGDNGVLVVDTFISQTPARDLLSEIRKITNLPVKYVVNTHYHLDHVAGNAIFTEAGATVIAHRNERGWVRTENLKFFRQNGATPTAEQRAQVASLVEPQITYDHILEVNLGSRLVRVVYLPGHTGGDSVVYIPDANVVFTGDLAWNQRIPNLIDATTSAWIETLDKMMAAHPNATFIPGHGDVASVQDIRAFHDYLAALRESIQKAQAAGQSGDALTQTVLADLKPKYGAWPGFERLSPLNVQQTAAELDGTKKIPQAE
ncbi:MAG TPA: MBL fold metallo-hydrolase [Terriglobales bacterium]|nr:MBL fold metallo-hydrolase [Terriglobales bacterium]